MVILSFYRIIKLFPDRYQDPPFEVVADEKVCGVPAAEAPETLRSRDSCSLFSVQYSSRGCLKI